MFLITIAGRKGLRGWHALDFSVSWVFNRIEVDPSKSSPSVLGDGFLTNRISCTLRNPFLFENLTDLSIAVKPRGMGAQSGPLGFRHSTHQVIISEEDLADKK